MKEQQIKKSKIQSYLILVIVTIFLAYLCYRDIIYKKYLDLTMFAALLILIILYCIFQGKQGKVGQDNPLTKNIGKSNLNIFLLVIIFVTLIAMLIFDNDFRLYFSGWLH